MESVVPDVGREELAMRAAALEERLEETRAERGQLATYKQVLRVPCHEAWPACASLPSALCFKGRFQRCVRRSLATECS